MSTPTAGSHCTCVGGLADSAIVNFNSTTAPLMRIDRNSSALFERCTIRDISNPEVNGSAVAAGSVGRTRISSSVLIRESALANNTSPFFSLAFVSGGRFYSDTPLLVFRDLLKKETVPAEDAVDAQSGAVAGASFLREEDRPDAQQVRPADMLCQFAAALWCRRRAATADGALTTHRGPALQLSSGGTAEVTSRSGVLKAGVLKARQYLNAGSGDAIMPGVNSCVSCISVCDCRIGAVANERHRASPHSSRRVAVRMVDPPGLALVTTNTPPPVSTRCVHMHSTRRTRISGRCGAELYVQQRKSAADGGRRVLLLKGIASFGRVMRGRAVCCVSCLVAVLHAACGKFSRAPRRQRAPRRGRCASAMVWALSSRAVPSCAAAATVPFTCMQGSGVRDRVAHAAIFRIAAILRMTSIRLGTPPGACVSASVNASMRIPGMQAPQTRQRSA